MELGVLNNNTLVILGMALLTLLFGPEAYAQEAVSMSRLACVSGFAGEFPCQDVDLLAFLPNESLGGGPDERVSDIWGWTDPQTGREYALVGRNAGAAFVDITNPSAPLYLGVVEANRSGALGKTSRPSDLPPIPEG